MWDIMQTLGGEIMHVCLSWICLSCFRKRHLLTIPSCMFFLSNTMAHTPRHPRPTKCMKDWPAVSWAHEVSIRYRAIKHRKGCSHHNDLSKSKCLLGLLNFKANCCRSHHDRHKQCFTKLPPPLVQDVVSLDPQGKEGVPCGSIHGCAMKEYKK